MSVPGVVEQTICIPPRATSFRAVCDACAAAQLPSRGYVGATVEGKLPLDRDHGDVTCARGHPIRVLRKQVDDLALSFVAPLRTDDDGAWHGSSVPDRSASQAADGPALSARASRERRGGPESRARACT